jgi:hypothetical protein
MSTFTDMRKIIFFLLIFATGCIQPGGKHPETTVKKHVFSYKKFQGNWLVKDYFDKLNSGTYVGSLNTSGYGITEIMIDSAHRDSIWLFNEDDSTVKVTFKVVGDDSILVKINAKDSACIFFTGRTGTIEVISLNRIRKFEYFHAPDSLLSETFPKSAFRRALNSSIARTSFIVYDPRLDQPHGTNARLDYLGNVYGLKNFKTFRIYVNVKRSNCRDVDRIDFSDGKKTYSYGLALMRNAIFLYHLALLGKNTGKPYYHKGIFYLELDRVNEKKQKIT